MFSQYTMTAEKGLVVNHGEDDCFVSMIFTEKDSIDDELIVRLSKEAAGKLIDDIEAVFLDCNAREQAVKDENKRRMECDALDHGPVAS